ncbi:unnamed protein product [Camellia sinensis]
MYAIVLTPFHSSILSSESWEVHPDKMEILFLLCSGLSTFFTSFLLSLLLPFRSLLRRGPTSATGVEPVSLYQGTVWHERRRPLRHSFRYSARYALIDLDRAPHPPPNHLSADDCRSLAQTNGPVFLLTIPPSVGYDNNPLSLYYCYEVEGFTKILKQCIAEVTNTPWGERVSFLFDPTNDLVAKSLHVSPFMDMLGNWSMRTNAPGDNIFVTISVRHPKLGDYFTASLTGKRISSSAADHALFFWLMPHKVALAIYWEMVCKNCVWFVLKASLRGLDLMLSVVQTSMGGNGLREALKLWWKGVAFIQHPRYANVGYRQEALIRDMKLQCCPAFSQDIQNHQPLEGSDSYLLKDKNGRNRRFTWRDAKWPWWWLLLAAMVDGFAVRKMREEDAGTWVCSGVEAARPWGRREKKKKKNKEESEEMGDGVQVG